MSGLPDGWGWNVYLREAQRWSTGIVPETRDWTRACLADENRAPCSANALSIHRDGKGRFWIMHDARGRVPFRIKNALAGPFKTEDAAKVAYLIHVRNYGWEESP